MSASRTKCTGSCQRAAGFHCECPCGGSRHGSARIKWARALAAQNAGADDDLTNTLIGFWRFAYTKAVGAVTSKVNARRKRLAKRTVAAKKRKARLPVTDAEVHAAEEFARSVVLVHWLSEHTDAREQIDFLAGKISSVGITAIDELAGPEDTDGKLRKRIQDRLGDHFWCDLLAALVVVLDAPSDLEAQIKDDVSTAVSHLADLVWTEIKQSRAQSHGYTPGSKSARPLRSVADDKASLDEVILRKVVTEVVKHVLNALIIVPGLSVEELQMRLRVLALIMCPDPSAHFLVWEHCWRPLVQSFLQEKLLEELDQLVDEGLGQPHLWDGADAGPPHRPK